MIWVLLTVFCGYALLVLSGCAWQRNLLYHPSRYSLAEEKSFANERGFVAWTNPAGEVIGWKLAARGVSTGSVLVVHGNGGSALNRDYFARPIHEATAMDVIVLEYPGYGARAGKPSQTSWLAAGEEAFALLPKGQPIHLVSESLGTGVAAHLARLHPKDIAGMAMFVPYDSLPSLAQSKMPLLLPYFFLVDRYQPAAWLKDYRGPITFVVAELDEIIPPRFGRQLYHSYAGPKQLQVIAGASHNEAAEQSPGWWRELFSFGQTNVN
ncbi:MAG: alpha/beta hydrolase [Verrucomicrobiota bacterium]